MPKGVRLNAAVDGGDDNVTTNEMVSPDTLEAVRKSMPHFEWEATSHRYYFRLILAPEEEGGYSIVVASIPGVVSQGETVEQAVENVLVALHAVWDSYAERGGELPRREQPLVPDHEAGEIVRDVIIDRA